ncbi:hypothetical protein B0T26DRAFT_296246 [Lasiosphaeria miniovina]|uniref:Uncharacterized protein n=1 Tax=Lasiosphaeria miniovina TaxID=1954250 RepID=A0AA40AKF1_9PEZI|nr:uncharacterized protein B0T26DRAFT_296246 [Lasiosphaeria miniovina]KAK0717402.1 hypothetical protein B0T26DRAFT_296246 [Lasiosphaeria miniovina]
MEVIRSMLACMFGPRSRHQGYTEIFNEKMPLYMHDASYQPDTMAYGTVVHSKPRARPSRPTDDEIADEIVRLLRQAEWNGNRLQQRIRDVLGERGWNRRTVEVCLDNIIDCVEDGRGYMGSAMRSALDRVTPLADEAFSFPRRHPESLDGFIAIVSVGIFMEMQGPWVLPVLGFGEVRGTDCSFKRGSVASWWTRKYAEYIPTGSVYAFLRQLDMVDDVE